VEQTWISQILPFLHPALRPDTSLRGAFAWNAHAKQADKSTGTSSSGDFMINIRQNWHTRKGMSRLLWGVCMFGLTISFRAWAISAA
jgi:hypothetical protein